GSPCSQRRDARAERRKASTSFLNGAFPKTLHSVHLARCESARARRRQTREPKSTDVLHRNPVRQPATVCSASRQARNRFGWSAAAPRSVRIFQFVRAVLHPVSRRRWLARRRQKSEKGRSACAPARWRRMPNRNRERLRRL